MEQFQHKIKQYFLKLVNGEAIYDSKLWRIAGEGPTQIQEGQFTDTSSKVFTSEDIRFTVNGSNIYATVLSFPKNGQVIIKSLADKNAAILPLFHGIIRNVSVLGFDEKPVWKRTEDALIINTKNINCDKPVVFKILVD